MDVALGPERHQGVPIGQSLYESKEEGVDVGGGAVLPHLRDRPSLLVDAVFNGPTERGLVGVAVVKQRQIPVWQNSRAVLKRELQRVPFEAKLVPYSAEAPDDCPGTRIDFRHLTQVARTDQIVPIPIDVDRVAVGPVYSASGQQHSRVDITQGHLVKRVPEEEHLP